MAGYGTQRRQDWSGNYPYQNKNPLALPNHSSNASGFVMPFPRVSHVTTSAQCPAPEQVTTSYRSEGGREDGTTFDDLPRTAGEAFKKARTEYKRGATKYDNGHEFETSRQFVEYGYHAMLVRSSTGPQTYLGPVIPNPLDHSSGVGTRYPVIPTSDLSWYGTKAINETIPTHPVVGLAQTLAELKREGLPALYGLATLSSSRNVRDLASSAGSEHLNHQFGIKPLANDLAGVLTGVSESSRRIQQLFRDSGRNVRRQYAFPIEETTTVYPVKLGRLAHCQLGGSAIRDSMFGTAAVRGQLQEIVTTKRHVTFSGAYTFYMPAPIRGALARIRKLQVEGDSILGTTINLDTLWELSPWTWLADWNYNIGDILSNMVRLSEDGLVIRYAYLMATTTVTRMVTLTDHPKPGGGVFPPVYAKYGVIHKKRIRASPNSFSSKPGPLTDRQWSILAALGMTKGGSRQMRLGD